MEYTVIKAYEMERLIDDVNKAIRQGWKLQGVKALEMLLQPQMVTGASTRVCI